MRRLIIAAALVAGLIPATAGPARAACDRRVSGGANLQSALNAAGAGATVCLSGTFRLGSTVSVPRGQTLVGGVILNGSASDGLRLSAGSVTLRNVEVAGFPGRGVVCGPRTAIYGSYIHDNRRNGVGCIAQNADWYIVIDGNRFARNGSNAWAGVGAASVKLMELSKPGRPLGAGARVTDNVVIDDVGNGIWLDRTSSASVVSGNVIHGQSRKAIRCEKCGGPVLFADNDVWNTGDECISVANSAVVTVRGNRTSDCGGAGIHVKNVDNVSKKIYPDYTPVDVGFQPRDIRVYDVRLAGDGVVGCGTRNVGCYR